MKNISILSLLFLAIGCSTPVNQEKENLDGIQILVGEINWDGLTSGEYATWFVPGYKDYQVDETSLSIIEPVIGDIQIKLFLGTWCEDSQVQVPQFYKMMDHVGYDVTAMEVVALERLENRDLVGPNGEEKELNITHVPTIIFYKDGVELGRIVEYPNRTIEKDMVEILMAE